jgi:ComF family protein
VGEGRACSPACRERLGLDWAVAAAPYRWPLGQRLLRIWKYQSVTEAGDRLLDLADRFWGREAERLGPDLAGAVLVPVPLHPFRLAERGFNQAEWLARIAARRFDRPLRPDLLVRELQWHKQATIRNEARRQKNAAQTVRLRTATIPPRIVLVDDVMTTGATLRACAAVLRRGGAETVGALTWLRG